MPITIEIPKWSELDKRSFQQALLTDLIEEAFRNGIVNAVDGQIMPALKLMRGVGERLYKKGDI